MQKDVKRVLVAFSMIFILCMSFIGTMAKAEGNVDNQTNIVESGNQNQSNTNLTNTNTDSINSNENSISNQLTDKDNSNSTNLGSNSTGSSEDSSTKKDGQETQISKSVPQWKNIDGKLYYVTKDGILKKTGWFELKDEKTKVNNEYYLDKDYSATIGWKKIDGFWYCFNEAGIKQTGWVQDDYSNWYHLDKKGRMEMGWIKDDGQTYYLNDEGIAVIGKKYIDNKLYFFGDSGALQTGFYSYGGKVYYSNGSGVMEANEWIKTKKGKYYVKADSSIATGYAIIDNQMQEFNSNGRYLGPTQMQDHLFVKQLNVGNADCAFIKLPSGETALIDTGTPETAEQVIDFLNKQDLKEEDNKKVIDYIIITHAHSDHIGGLAPILNDFRVKKVYIPDIAVMKDWYSDVKITTESAASIDMMKVDYNIYENAVQAMKDKNIEFTNTKHGDFIDENKILQFVQSDKDFGPIGSEKITQYYWGINENSAIVYLNYGDLQELFTADMEWNSEKDFWESDLLDGRKVDVLKVPHHGHDTSSTSDFLAYLNPAVGIISRAAKDVVKNEAYNNLLSSGVSIYETSEKDGVSIYATPENWTLEN
jgi:competence protein ComEC